MSDRPLSLWWDTLPADLRVPLGQSLGGDEVADVAIVGAGYTGLWTAYYLTKADPSLRITILEANEAGFGASGRNGGWASGLFPTSLEALARQSSRSEAVRLKRAMNATIDEIARVAEAESWDIGWHKGGTVVLARSKVQWQAAKEDVASQREWGFGVCRLRVWSNNTDFRRYTRMFRVECSLYLFLSKIRTHPCSRT